MRRGKSGRQSRYKADLKTLKKLCPLQAIYFQFSKLRSRTFAFLILLIIIKMILLIQCRAKFRRSSINLFMLAFLRSQVCLVSLPWIATGSDPAAIDHNQAEPLASRSQPGPDLQPPLVLLPTIPLSNSKCGPHPSETHVVAEGCIVIAELSSPFHPRTLSRLVFPLPRLLPKGLTLQSTCKVGTQENLGSPNPFISASSKLDFQTTIVAFDFISEMMMLPRFTLLIGISLSHCWVFKLLYYLEPPNCVSWFCFRKNWAYLFLLGLEIMLICASWLSLYVHFISQSMEVWGKEIFFSIAEYSGQFKQT